MKATITFSAIIPAYNCSGTVARAIDSALKQAYPPLEILVIDDGSTDNTQEVVSAYGDKVRYFLLPHSGYVGAVRNRGIVESRGEYLAFLDADDAWYPNKLEKAAECIEGNPRAGLIYSDFNIVDETGSIQRRVHCRELSRHAYKQLLELTPIATCTAVVKRDCFDVCGLFSQDVAGCEDWEMWIRIAKKYSVIYLPFVLAEYTLHNASTSLSNSEDWYAAQVRVLEKVFANDPNLTETEKRRIRARAHYCAGRLRSMHGQNQEALLSFRRSVREDFFQCHSWSFIALLKVYALIRPLIERRDRWSSSSKQGSSVQ